MWTKRQTSLPKLFRATDYSTEVSEIPLDYRQVIEYYYKQNVRLFITRYHRRILQLHTPFLKERMKYQHDNKTSC